MKEEQFGRAPLAPLSAFDVIVSNTKSSFHYYVQIQIDRAEKEKQTNTKLPEYGNHFELLNSAGWLETITTFKKCRDELRFQKEKNNDLVQFDEEIKNLYQGVNLVLNQKSRFYVSNLLLHQLSHGKVCCFTSQ